MKLLLATGALLLAALCGCAARPAPQAPRPVTLPPPAPGRSPPASNSASALPAPTQPGVHLRTIHGAQMPVLVAGDETPDLRLLNGGIRALAEAGGQPLAILVDSEEYLQAVVLHTGDDGAPLADSFVYSLDEARAVRLSEAVSRHGVDIVALYDRFEAQLKEETGRKLTGLAAAAFHYLDGGEGILLLLSYTCRDGDGAVARGICAYHSAQDTLTGNWPAQFGFYGAG